MGWQQELGRQIRDARRRAGMTQQELARHLTVRRETVSNYENGKTPALVNVIAEMAQVLDAEFLIGDCKITKADLKRIQDTLNRRPRPTLNLDTPAQRLAALLDQAA